MYRILKDFKGSPDGGRVVLFSAGEQIAESADFPPDLIAVAIEEGWAEEIKAPKKKAARKK